MTSNIFIEKYSDKSFVIRGETTEYKDIIKSMGGKWNSRLKEQNNQEKFGAWLFWNDKRSEIDEWFDKGCPKIEKNFSKLINNDSFTPSQKRKDKEDYIYLQNLEAKIDRLVIMVELLCSNKKIVVPEITSSYKSTQLDREYEEPEPIVTLNNHRRLLLRKKSTILPYGE